MSTPLVSDSWVLCVTHDCPGHNFPCLTRKYYVTYIGWASYKDLAEGVWRYDVIFLGFQMIPDKRRNSRVSQLSVVNGLKWSRLVKAQDQGIFAKSTNIVGHGARSYPKLKYYDIMCDSKYHYCRSWVSYLKLGYILQD